MYPTTLIEDAFKITDFLSADNSLLSILDRKGECEDFKRTGENHQHILVLPFTILICLP